jgi:hypothetical protein
MPFAHARRPARRSTLAAAALAVALLAAATQVIAATPSGSYVTGGANKDDWTVAGTVKKTVSGASGHIRITRDAEPRPMVCDYHRFTNLSVIANIARFDATGTCVTDSCSGVFSFAVSNAFRIEDHGKPGDDLDAIDVNFYGVGGIAIPGGLIDDGNFDVKRLSRRTATRRAA